MKSLSSSAGQSSIDALWQAYWKDRGDWQIRNRIVEFYYPLVPGLVQRVVERCRIAVDRDLIESAACAGLLKAVERFDPKRGAEFPRFASVVMRNHIARDFKQNRALSICCESLDEEWFAKRHCRVERPCCMRIETGLPAFLEALARSGGCGSTDDCTSDDPNAPSAQTVEHGARYGAVVAAYREMKPSVKAILFLHLFERLSHQEIARILKISRVRVTQVIGQAVRRLTG